MDSVLCDIAENTTEKMKQDLNNARRLVVTMDCWSQKDCASTHVAISAALYSVIDNGPIHILLDISETPLPITKDDLTTKLETCVERWGIDTDKIVLIRMENSCNILRAINSFLEFPEHEGFIVKEVDMPIIEFKGIRAMHCLTVTLQSVIKDILNKPLISNILFNYRGNVHSQMLKINRGNEVFLDNSTSWRSTYSFIDNCLKLKDDVVKLGYNFYDCGRAKLQELKNVLDPIKNVIDLLERESLPLSNAIPSLLEIFVVMRKLPVTEITSGGLDFLKKRLSHILDVKDQNFDPLPAVSSLLDPTVSCFMHRLEVQDLLDAAIKHIRLSVSYLLCSSVYIILH